jgi:hypothetical protein
MADPKPTRPAVIGAQHEAGQPQLPAAPEETRRRLLRGAVSSVPVMMTLASGAALAQASASRRATIVSEPLNSESPNNATCAFGYVDNGDTGLDGTDTAFGFQQELDGSLCIQDSSPGDGVTNRYQVGDPDNLNPDISTTPPVPPKGDSNVVLITASSWASLDTAEGGTCTGDAVEPLAPLQITAPDQSLGEPSTGFFDSGTQGQ